MNPMCSKQPSGCGPFRTLMADGVKPVAPMMILIRRELAQAPHRKRLWLCWDYLQQATLEVTRLLRALHLFCAHKREMVRGTSCSTQAQASQGSFTLRIISTEIIFQFLRSLHTARRCRRAKNNRLEE